VNAGLTTRETRVLALSAAAAAFVVIGIDASGPLRAVPVLTLFLLGPGIAWVRFVPVSRLGHQLAVAMAVSLAGNAVAAQLLLWLGLLDPVPGLVTVAAITTAGALAPGPAAPDRAVSR